MLVFYTKNKPNTPLSLFSDLNCNTACASNCFKPKTKCCKKYKKKGVNCKRCPLVFSLKDLN